jgi:molecular chaperone DnaK
MANGRGGGALYPGLGVDDVLPLRTKEGREMARPVGIDFGTSKSVVCVLEGGRPVIVANAEGSRSTPSVVAVAGDGEVLVGEAARRQAVTNAERTIRAVKRHLGTPWTVEIDGTLYTAPQISAFIMQKLVREASSYLGEQVTDAVVTAPAYMDEASRHAIGEAAQIAGLNVLRVIGAAEAAAVAYHAARRGDATIVVFVLGGGACEVSLFDVGDGVVEVKAAGGDARLGGDDWNQRVVDHLVHHVREVAGVDLSTDKTALQRLREAAEQAKIELSSAAESQIAVPYIAQSANGPVHLHTVLTRTEFQGMTADLLDRCAKPFDQVIADAGIGAGDIDHVLLVGGATRMPAIVDLVRTLAGGKEPTRNVNPDEGAAMGAAWLAGSLAATATGVLLLSVTPSSLGVATKGGVFTKLIGRNTKLPAKDSKIFTVSKAPGTGDTVTIPVYRGEQALAAQNRLVGVLRLTGVPRGREIEVTADIDTNGVARVTARDLRSGTEQSVTITGTPADAQDTITGQAELTVRGPAAGGRARHGRPASAAMPPVVDLQPSPEVSQAAQEHDLGRLRQSFEVRPPGTFRKARALGGQFFEFERGLVRGLPGSPPETFRWDQIETVLRSSTEHYTNYHYRNTGFTCTLTRRDGTSTQVMGTYQDPQRMLPVSAKKVSSDHRNSVQRACAALCEDAARHVAAAQLPAARAALARGEELVFGDIVIAANGLRVPKRDRVPWTEISDVQVSNGSVEIFASPYRMLWNQPVGAVPNFLLFVTLADALRAPQRPTPQN